MLRSFVFAIALSLASTTVLASNDIDIQLRSVTTTTSNDGTCSTYKNVDFLGWDIGHEKAASIDDCCGLCHDKPGCSTYSWSDFEGGTCWLKNGHNDMSFYKEGVNSGIVPEKKVPYVFAYENSMDYEGGDNDIKNVPGSWIDKCIQPCQDTPGCGAISWNGDNGGTCWLKKQRGAAHQQDGVTSGVILDTE